jgi:hypothetical protein
MESLGYSGNGAMLAKAILLADGALADEVRDLAGGDLVTREKLVKKFPGTFDTKMAIAAAVNGAKQRIFGRGRRGISCG